MKRSKDRVLSLFKTCKNKQITNTQQKLYNDTKTQKLTQQNWKPKVVKYRNIYKDSDKIKKPNQDRLTNNLINTNNQILI